MRSRSRPRRPPRSRPPLPATSTLEEVTVTGSRIKRTTDFTTATPTTVIDTATMENLGVVNVGDVLEMIPSNISNFTPATTANGSFNTGAYIADLRGLNPFFGSRTLTLIDGQRAVSTNTLDSFDLNFIPQVLVQRIDTVTGGASAAYGSGAVCGVPSTSSSITSSRAASSMPTPTTRITTTPRAITSPPPTATACSTTACTS